MRMTISLGLKERLGESDMHNWISPEKVANMLALKPATIRIWLRSGKLKGSKAGSVWRVPLNEVNSLLIREQVLSPKLDRMPSPLLRLNLEDGNTMSFFEIEGFIQVAVNGRPKAMLFLHEFVAIVLSAIRSSGSKQAVIELIGGFAYEGDKGAD